MMEEKQSEYLKLNPPDRHNNWQLPDSIWYSSLFLALQATAHLSHSEKQLSKVMEIFQSVGWPTGIISEILQSTACLMACSH